MEIFDYYSWLFPTFAVLFGLIIGSFLNVVIHRLPIIMYQEWRAECEASFPNHFQTRSDATPPSQTTTESISLSLPASRCPNCHTPIRVRDNIPLLSWLLLKGKCRDCHAPISKRYPLVELGSALTSWAVSLHFGMHEYTVAAMLFSFILIAAALIDFDTLLLPDQLTQPLLWCGIALSLFGISPISLNDAVIGAMAGYLSLWSVYWGFKLLTGKEGMGYGDFKLLAALGAWLGWQLLPLIVLLASMIGILFALSLRTWKKNESDQMFPFGPALALAGWISMMWGTQLLELYWSLVLR